MPAAAGHQLPQAGAGVAIFVAAFFLLDFFFGDRFFAADFLAVFFFGDFFDEAFLAAFFFAAIWCGSFPMSARDTTLVRPLGRYQPGRDNTAGHCFRFKAMASRRIGGKTAMNGNAIPFVDVERRHPPFNLAVRYWRRHLPTDSNPSSARPTLPIVRIGR
jgi:hypothetical protein